MTPCDYQILEYTTSELQTHGVPFIVILRLHMQNSFTLTGYVLRNWRAKIGSPPKEEFSDIAVLLDDLRFHCREGHLSDADAGFFDRLQKLSVGPVRSSVSGSCLSEELETIVPMFFDGLISIPNWHESFERVGEYGLEQR
jgi:hypothetical protein